ncbi:MAG: SMC-Scp complex subunit ScpB [Candidatus Omnitrophica bacterium]|nr:SMC-Scp complex subunit ScpB [Candidatus Omnitrophota bacterium]
MADTTVKSVLETLLFVSEKPLLIEQAKKVLSHMSADEIRTALEEMKTEYETTNRGLRITEVAGGFRMVTAPNLLPFLKKFFAKEPRADRLSSPALETLAIIAYKQPVTRLEIESLRKVNIDGLMKTLLQKNLIRVAGRREAPGRPQVFATTRQFLEYFGLKDLSELPKIEDFAALVEKQEMANEPVKTTDAQGKDAIPEIVQTESVKNNEP